MFGNCIAHPTVMMRREVFETFGPYRRDALHVEDYDLWVRANSRVGVANVPEVLLQYRVHHASVSGVHAEIQASSGAAVKARAIAQATGIAVPESAMGNLSEIHGSENLLRSLYSAYLKKENPARSERAAIALDLLRRFWSVASTARKKSEVAGAGIAIRGLLAARGVLSWHGLRLAIFYGRWFRRQSAQARKSIQSGSRVRN
jgi:hypothetical protein